MGLRVVQWATSSVGVAAIKAILEHPELELAGCWVHSKKTRPARTLEIIGTAPLRLVATDSVDGILAMDAEAVVYAPLLPNADGSRPCCGRARMSSARSAGFIRARQRPPRCRRRRSPATQPCTGRESVRCGHRTVPAAAVGYVHRHHPRARRRYSDLHLRCPRRPAIRDGVRCHAGEGTQRSHAKLLSGGFVQSVRLIVDRLGFAAEPVIQSNQQVAVATAPIDSPIGVIQPGEVAGRRFRWDAVVTNAIVVPRRGELADGTGQFGSGMVISARPVSATDRGAGPPPHLRHRQGWQPETVEQGLISNPGVVATAAHCVNSIPAVCSAEPGIRSFFRSAPLTGRAAPCSDSRANHRQCGTRPIVHRLGGSLADASNQSDARSRLGSCLR